MLKLSVEMHFCRRCGTPLTARGTHDYVCERGHSIFMNAAPAVAIVLRNEQGQILLIERGIEPGKGQLDIPGGFCDGPETFEAAAAREIQEEIGLTPEQYTAPVYCLSGLDLYTFGAETLPVIGMMFSATLKPGAIPHPADDAAAILFMEPNAIPMEKVYFPSVRAALTRACKQSVSVTQQ